MVGTKLDSNCVYASNPYHECDGYCKEKRTRKGSANHGGQLSKMMPEDSIVHPACADASNPYHECAEYCFRKIAVAKGQEFVRESDSTYRSFGRRKKDSISQEKSLEVLYPVDVASPGLQITSPTKAKLMVVEPKASSEQHVKDTIGQEPSFGERQVSTTPVLQPAILLQHESPKDPSKYGTTCESNETEEDKQFHSSPVILGSPMSLNFSTTACSLKDKGVNESQSVISDSDSRVRVGNYLVKESISLTLQSIFDKYGDIAASCKLKSLSVLTSYLECLCSVFQELQSTVHMQLTKSKVKEISAILKDVESSGINVSWIQPMLEETTDSIELVNQQRAAEAAKFNCDQALESTKKELESVLENLTIKEKEIENDKVRVDEIKDNLRELEFESSRLNTNISFIRSKLENFRCKALSDELV